MQHLWLTANYFAKTELLGSLELSWIGSMRGWLSKGHWLITECTLSLWFQLHQNTNWVNTKAGGPYELVIESLFTQNQIPIGSWLYSQICLTCTRSTQIWLTTKCTTYRDHLDFLSLLWWFSSIDRLLSTDLQIWFAFCRYTIWHIHP